MKPLCLIAMTILCVSTSAFAGTIHANGIYRYDSALGPEYLRFNQDLTYVADISKPTTRKNSAVQEFFIDAIAPYARKDGVACYANATDQANTKLDRFMAYCPADSAIDSVIQGSIIRATGEFVSSEEDVYVALKKPAKNPFVKLGPPAMPFTLYPVDGNILNYSFEVTSPTTAKMTMLDTNKSEDITLTPVANQPLCFTMSNFETRTLCRYDEFRTIYQWRDGTTLLGTFVAGAANVKPDLNAISQNWTNQLNLIIQQQ